MNLAARLETHTKIAARNPDRRRDARSLAERVEVESLGPVMFKGKTLPVEIYSVSVGQKV